MAQRKGSQLVGILLCRWMVFLPEDVSVSAPGEKQKYFRYVGGTSMVAAVVGTTLPIAVVAAVGLGRSLKKKLRPYAQALMISDDSIDLLLAQDAEAMTAMMKWKSREASGGARIPYWAPAFNTDGGGEFVSESSRWVAGYLGLRRKRVAFLVSD